MVSLSVGRYSVTTVCIPLFSLIWASAREYVCIYVEHRDKTGMRLPAKNPFSHMRSNFIVL